MWYDDTREVSAALLFVTKNAPTIKINNGFRGIDVRFRDDVVQETMLKLLTSYKFVGFTKFNSEMKGFAITTMRNTFFNMAKEAGDYRVGAKSDKHLQGQSIQIHHDYYSTTDTIDDESDKNIILENKNLSPERQLILADMYHNLKSIIDDELANIHPPEKAEFLSLVFFHYRSGMTYKALAQSIGYHHSNPTMVVKQFTERINTILKENDVDVYVEQTANEVDLLLQGKLNN